MNFTTAAGMIAVLALIIGVGIISGKKIKNASDFLTGGGQAGSWLVCGAIMGSLVSSQATIGTAQLAFSFGLSAWWFTLGSAIGCVFLALVYAARLRASGCITEVQIISKEYGKQCGRYASILCSIGIFISVLAQFLAGMGLLTVIFPRMTMLTAAILCIVSMSAYIVFGGAWGAGMGGVAKLILLYATSMLGMFIVILSSGGTNGFFAMFYETLTNTEIGSLSSLSGSIQAVKERYFSLVARGAAKDIGSGISLVLGVLSTQTYAQAIWSAKSDKAARRGALLSALLIPPLGIAGISIGLYMRMHYITQAEADALLAAGQCLPELPVLASSIQAFPMFVYRHMPYIFGGIGLGALFITIVGGGAGLTLGMTTIIGRDIIRPAVEEKWNSRMELITNRILMGFVFITAAVLALIMPGQMINDMGFLSMGLRGTTIFLPMTCAIWFKEKLDKKVVAVSVIAAPLAVIFAKVLGLGFDPLYVGIAVSALLCVAAAVKAKVKRA